MSRAVKQAAAARGRQRTTPLGWIRRATQSAAARGIQSGIKTTRELLSGIAGLGRTLRGLWGGRTQRQRTEAAEAILESVGVEVDAPKGTRAYDQAVEEAAKAVTEAATRGTIPPIGTEGRTVAPGGREPPRRPTITDGPQWAGRSVTAPPLPGEESPLSEEIRTPNSSNVYSFQYDFSSSTLYVRFKAPRINPGSVSVSGSGLKSQGRASSGKTDAPGARYAYLDVPIRVWKRLSQASSAGKAVWDELRIRGTVYGHQYRYQLIQGALVPTGTGQMGVYVPRRATERGYRKRAAPSLGTGRRAWIESTLPERITGEPNRGTPNRGEPNRG